MKKRIGNRFVNKSGRLLQLSIYGRINKTQKYPLNRELVMKRNSSGFESDPKNQE